VRQVGHLQNYTKMYSQQNIKIYGSKFYIKFKYRRT